MREILKFINHASFIVETSNSILLVDPWVEGYVFDNGWSLLDKSTSNKELCRYLKKQSKSLFIWYSHEHPDHFSVSFIKELKRQKLNAKFFFQRTLDKRLTSFLRKNNFEIIESNFVKESIEEKFNLITFPHEDGDSFLLILVNGKSILNLNDCVIDTKKKSWKLNKQLSKYCSKIDIMMTQFGYANWIGNPDQIMLRRNASDEKISRIKLQNKIINPKTIIPFASFVSFCHKENFYMNDVQNTPFKIYKSNLSHEFRDKMIIMKPWDEIDLKNLELNSIKLLKFQNNAIPGATAYDIFDIIKTIFREWEDCENA